MITVAAPNVIPKLMMSKVSDILTSFDLTINGVHVDTIKTHENSSHSEPGHADLALVRFQVDELNRSSRGKKRSNTIDRWQCVREYLSSQFTYSEYYSLSIYFDTLSYTRI